MLSTLSSIQPCMQGFTCVPTCIHVCEWLCIHFIHDAYILQTNIYTHAYMHASAYTDTNILHTHTHTILCAEVHIQVHTEKKLLTYASA